MANEQYRQALSNLADAAYDVVLLELVDPKLVKEGRRAEVFKTLHARFVEVRWALSGFDPKQRTEDIEVATVDYNQALKWRYDGQ